MILLDMCSIQWPMHLHYVSGDLTKPENDHLCGSATFNVLRPAKYKEWNEEPVVRHAVLQQYNDCRYRKSIRGCIPMYIFATVYFLYFLQALFVSDFTSRTPNKDKQVDQPFHCLFVQVLYPRDVHELYGSRVSACYPHTRKNSTSRKKWYKIFCPNRFPRFKRHSVEHG